MELQGRALPLHPLHPALQGFLRKLHREIVSMQCTQKNYSYIFKERRVCKRAFELWPLSDVDSFSNKNSVYVTCESLAVMLTPR